MFRKIRKILKSFFAKPPLGTWEKWLSLQGVELRGKVSIFGKPIISRWGNGTIVIDDGVTLDSDSRNNYVGIIHPCKFAVGGDLYIGKDSGLSGTLIYCKKSVTIGSHVGIGANVMIYDTDFHPVNPYERIVTNSDNDIQCKPVQIDDYVWIGANTMILKGVHIGRGSVIGAGSVVTSDVPELAVYAGNPARFIKNVELTDAQYKQLFGEPYE